MEMQLMPFAYAADRKMKIRIICFATNARQQDYIAVKEELSTMERVFQRENIPRGVAINFTNRARRATADPSF